MLNTFMLNVPNTPEGLAQLADLKKFFRKSGYTCKVRGRGPRKAIFAKTGRVYIPGIANRNDFSMKSPEAPYATHWAVYVYPKYNR
jgi:hypothetical protein